ncbi:MAG: hypothetical protein M3R02_24245 [Chloroflexota bacterium]|nr:hypothetical protein [Chloroflexota bacterium]
MHPGEEERSIAQPEKVALPEVQRKAGLEKDPEFLQEAVRVVREREVTRHVAAAPLGGHRSAR